MLSKDQLDEIEQYEKAAFPGPWVMLDLRDINHDGSDWFAIKAPDHDYWVADLSLTSESCAKQAGQFIAGARTWVPQLLATVYDLQRDVDRLDRACEELIDEREVLLDEIEQLKHQIDQTSRL